MEEGVIKFRCEHIVSTALPDDFLSDLKHFRQLLYMQKLIGVDGNEIGYGNISQRYNDTDQFIISGTQTGHLPELSSSHFTKVEAFNIANNWLKCCGPIKASSESLTHAALYISNKNINAVIHIHHEKTWQKYIHKLPTTTANISYGSPEMACAISNLALHNPKQKVIIMSGHKDGIIAFGESLQIAYNELMKIIS
ncbi:MAG: class II aldolase/adducin family protein [Chitinophagaceae bacterium]|nr:MAG: class II aldolase/adducin family protein [Chitinophagaceae bacterium]